MKEYHLDLIKEKLSGPSIEHIIVHNQWAATGLDRYHKNSEATMQLRIDGQSQQFKLLWDSNFSKATMKENTEIANHGAVAVAWFVMSVFMGYNYVEQSEIGDGVDYRFLEKEPNDDDLNFLTNNHYVEISGILEESKSNTLKERIKQKHQQINRGHKKDQPASVVVTLFSQPMTVKETHK